MENISLRKLKEEKKIRCLEDLRIKMMIGKKRQEGRLGLLGRR